jgi:3-mercaptopyruvate sulfurtransferase SseA
LAPQAWEDEATAATRRAAADADAAALLRAKHIKDAMLVAKKKALRDQVSSSRMFFKVEIQEHTK